MLRKGLTPVVLQDSQGSLKNPQTKKMKIAILSLAIGEKYKEATKYSWLSKKKYAEQHGYDFITDESVYDETRPIAWSKILLISKYLSQYDHVVWIDADAMIMNHSQKMEDKITTFGDSDIVVSNDINGMINTGVIVVKNTLFSAKFMETIYKPEHFVDHGNWEQQTFINLYNSNTDDCQNHIKVLTNNRTVLQSYFYHFVHGDFIIHLVGFRSHWSVHMKRIFKAIYQWKRIDETTQEYNNRIEWMKHNDIRAL